MMHSHYLTNSIEPPATYSVGQSATFYGTHWNLVNSEAGGRAYLSSDLHGGFRFDLTGPSGNLFLEGYGQGEEARLRMACMMILGVMPSEGLDEAIDALKDMFEFYASPPVNALPSPRVIEMDALVTSID